MTTIPGSSNTTGLMWVLYDVKGRYIIGYYRLFSSFLFTINICRIIRNKWFKILMFVKFVACSVTLFHNLNKHSQLLSLDESDSSAAFAQLRQGIDSIRMQCFLHTFRVHTAQRVNLPVWVICQSPRRRRVITLVLSCYGTPEMWR